MAAKKKYKLIKPHRPRRPRSAGLAARRAAAGGATKPAGPAPEQGSSRRRGFRPAVGLEFDVPPTSGLPELAGIAGLRLHWLAGTPRRRRRAFQLLQAAAGRKSLEPCLADIQKALAELYVSPLHAAQIIVMLYCLLAGPSEAETVRQVVAVIRRVLESFEGKSRPAGGEGSAARARKPK